MANSYQLVTMQYLFEQLEGGSGPLGRRLPKQSNQQPQVISSGMAAPQALDKVSAAFTASAPTGERDRAVAVTT